MISYKLLQLSTHIFKYINLQTTSILIIIKMNQIAIINIDQNFKTLLNSKSNDYAWEILQIEADFQINQEPSIQLIMRLLQLYMFGVQVLQNEDDQRYKFFNTKIHSLMMKKAVMQKLHRSTTGNQINPSTMEMAHQKQLQDRKTQLQLQVYLQKDQYNLQNVKQIIKKQEHYQIMRKEQIKNHLMNQHANLQERILTRKMRSGSKSKDKVKLIQELNSPKMISRASYTIANKEDKVQIKKSPPSQPRISKINNKQK